DVFHSEVEERVARLGEDAELVPVAEVGRVLRDDAVAEEAEDIRVLLLQPELELRLVFVQLIEVRHGLILAPACLRPAAGARLAGGAPGRAPGGARRRTLAPRGERGAPSSPAPRPTRRRRGAGRGRSSAGPSAPRACARGPGSARRRAGGRGAPSE